MTRPRLSLPFSGTKARAARERKGLTLGQLAERCSKHLGRDVHLSAISKVELGHNMPSPGLLKAMADSLECDVDDLLEAGAA